MTTKETCVVAECERGVRIQVKKMCAMHYQRFMRHGNTDDPKPNLGPGNSNWKGGRSEWDGYQHISVYPGDMQYEVGIVKKNGSVARRIPEHRYVMGVSLGRPLTSVESVHHLNGDRADNRLDNLQLWTTSQPYGQRVEDKVAWAIELLSSYGYKVSKE